MERHAGTPRSNRLDAGELGHLGPFLSFIGDEFTELGGRPRKYSASEIGNPVRSNGCPQGLEAVGGGRSL